LGAGPLGLLIACWVLPNQRVAFKAGLARLTHSTALS
jgi:hypothetical protein